MNNHRACLLEESASIGRQSRVALRFGGLAEQSPKIEKNFPMGYFLLSVPILQKVLSLFSSLSVYRHNR